MVKVNDVVAAAVLRSAARVPAQERERFRRQIQPAVGRASVPKRSLVESGQTHRLTAPGTGASDAPNRRAFASRLPAGFMVARLFSMTAVVRARLELGGRRRPRADSAGPDRADGGGADSGGADAPGWEAGRARSGLPQT